MGPSSHEREDPCFPEIFKIKGCKGHQSTDADIITKTNLLKPRQRTT